MKCSKCNSTKFWLTSRGRFKCKQCRYLFTPKSNIFKVNNRLLKEIISEFILEHSTNIILDRVNISKYKLLKILTGLRIAMTLDYPDIFAGIVEVDETYLGGQWKNKRKLQKKLLGKAKRGRGTFKQPVFGILCRQGKVWAEVVDSVEAVDLQPRIEKQVKKDR